MPNLHEYTGPKKTIVFIDSGDTIIDEGTQQYEADGVTVKSAECIPGAKEALAALHRQGYTLVLVADGLAKSFENVYAQHNMKQYFSGMVYSEQVGKEKPNRHMFLSAASAIGITEENFGRVVMVGNNLARDVKGANALGITSVFYCWSSRYPRQPKDSSETPDFQIHSIAELPPLIERLEATPAAWPSGHGSKA